MDDVKTTPVVITGAGPVGLTTALLLARWGVPSVVLEARGRPNQSGSRAIAFQRDTLDIFDRVGCATDILAEGVPWSRGRTYYQNRELRVVDYADPGHSPFPAWLNISQTRVEQHLRSRAHREPLIDLRFGQPVVAFHCDDTGVTVDTGTQLLRCTHLVGADGARSTVRDLAGIGFPGRSYPDRFLIVDLVADLPLPRERRFYFDPPFHPGRQVLVHQCPDFRWRIDWQVPPDYDPAAESASGQLDQRIRAVIGDHPYTIDWLSVYRVEQRMAQTFRSGLVFLAGDAAHLYIPHGARGLNSGLQDADNLAWKLALTRRGVAGRILLDTYNQERRAAAAENLRVTHGTLRFLIPQTLDDHITQRQTLARAATDPAVRDKVNSGHQSEPFWYLDSPLTTSDAQPENFPTTPQTPRPVVPGVLCPDAPVQLPGNPTRLRRLIGTGFLILLGDPTRIPDVHDATHGLPVQIHALPTIDPDATVRTILNATPDSVHVIRPDGYLAAAFTTFDPVALTTALRRACGQPLSTSRPAMVQPQP